MPFPSWCIQSYSFLKYRGIFLNLALQWHHNERDGVSNHLCTDCLFNHFCRKRLKKTPRHWPLWGGFPLQRVSNAENVSIWWHHHDHYIHHGAWTRWLTHWAYFQMHFPEHKHNVCFGSCGHCWDYYSDTISSFKSRLLILWNKMLLFW